MAPLENVGLSLIVDSGERVHGHVSVRSGLLQRDRLRRLEPDSRFSIFRLVDDIAWGRFLFDRGSLRQIPERALAGQAERIDPAGRVRRISVRVPTTLESDRVLRDVPAAFGAEVAKSVVVKTGLRVMPLPRETNRAVGARDLGPAQLTVGR